MTCLALAEIDGHAPNAVDVRRVDTLYHVFNDGRERVHCVRCHFRVSSQSETKERTDVGHAGGKTVRSNLTGVEAVTLDYVLDQSSELVSGIHKQRGRGDDHDEAGKQGYRFDQSHAGISASSQSVNDQSDHADSNGIEYGGR